jgi:hypothetical protein
MMLNRNSTINLVFVFIITCGSSFGQNSKYELWLIDTTKTLNSSNVYSQKDLSFHKNLSKKEFQKFYSMFNNKYSYSRKEYPSCSGISFQIIKVTNNVDFIDTLYIGTNMTCSVVFSNSPKIYSKMKIIHYEEGVFLIPSLRSKKVKRIKRYLSQLNTTFY